MADLLRRSGARRYWWIWAVVIPIVFWTVVRLFGLESGYPLIAIMAFTPYVAVAALFIAGVATALRNWGAAVVTGLATLCLLSAILPRMIGSSTAQAAGHETLEVLAANVYYGDADARALVSLVDRYHADLLSVEELSPRFAAELHRAGIAERLPDSMLPLHGGRFATGLYSRFPLTPLSRQGRFAVRVPRATIALPDGRRLRVAGVHPPTPIGEKIGPWRDALESLPSTGTGVPWVLAGDFNATLDHAELRDVLDRGYRDAAEATEKGLVPTWPTKGQGFLPPLITVDHLLADRRLGIADYGVDDLAGSDHRTIHAEVVLP